MLGLFPGMDEAMKMLPKVQEFIATVQKQAEEMTAKQEKILRQQDEILSILEKIAQEKSK